MEDRYRLSSRIARPVLDWSGMGTTRLAQVTGMSVPFASLVRGGMRELSAPVTPQPPELAKDTLTPAAPWIAAREDVSQPADDWAWLIAGEELPYGLTALRGFGRSARVGVYSPDVHGLAMAVAASAPINFVRPVVHVVPASVAFLGGAKGTVTVTQDTLRDHICGLMDRLKSGDEGIPLLRTTTTTNPSTVETTGARAGPVAGGIPS